MSPSTFYIIDTPIGDYRLVYEGDSACAKRLAIRLRAHIRAFCGAELALTDDAGEEGEREILIGMTRRTRVQIGEYEYAVAVTHRKMYVAFRSLFAEEHALRFLEAEIFTAGRRPLMNGDFFCRDVRELLREGQKNAFSKQGDLRALTSNICGSYRCCEDRMALLKTVFCAYAPDILLCQESGPRWRDFEGYLCNRLWEAGYREARVESVLNDNYTPVFYRAER